jgi:hypothetical protein
MAHPKHDAVRQRYGFRCGYCGVSEEDVGGELTIDHYCPTSKGGDDSDANLVYACSRCNLYKSDFWPDDQDVAQQRRVLHPLLDDLAKHVNEDENGHLLPLTEAGSFHIAVLELNRPPLVAHRRREQRLQRQLRQNAVFLTVIQMQRRVMIEMTSYIDYLQNRLLDVDEDN